MILNSIIKAGENGVDKNQFLGLVMFETGLSRRCLLEYLKSLKNAELISEREGILYAKN